MTKDTSSESNGSIIEFPCEYILKAMGKSAQDIEKITTDIIVSHSSKTDLLSVRVRQSANEKYTSVTVTFNAQNKTQVDAIYMDLCADPRILMAL